MTTDRLRVCLVVLVGDGLLLWVFRLPSMLSLIEKRETTTNEGRIDLQALVKMQKTAPSLVADDCDRVHQDGAPLSKLVEQAPPSPSKVQQPFVRRALMPALTGTCACESAWQWSPSTRNTCASQDSASVATCTSNVEVPDSHGELRSRRVCSVRNIGDRVWRRRRWGCRLDRSSCCSDSQATVFPLACRSIESPVSCAPDIPLNSHSTISPLCQ